MFKTIPSVVSSYKKHEHFNHNNRRNEIVCIFVSTSVIVFFYSRNEVSRALKIVEEVFHAVTLEGCRFFQTMLQNRFLTRVMWWSVL